MALFDCEEKDLKTNFELKLKDVVNSLDKSSDNKWVNYEILINTGEDKQVFGSKFPASSEDVLGKFVFAIAPHNRLELFIESIEKFLRNEDQTEFIFEPADPSFELIIKKSHIGGFQVYLWIDSGNTKQLRYTWDAKGIRFYSSKENIEEFIKQVRAEMPTVSA